MDIRQQVTLDYILSEVVSSEDASGNFPQHPRQHFIWAESSGVGVVVLPSITVDRAFRHNMQDRQGYQTIIAIRHWTAFDQVAVSEVRVAEP
jgi:hypothetical protein